MRVAGKGLIDRDRVLRFTFGGQSFEAFYRRVLKTGLDGQDLGAHKLF